MMKIISMLIALTLLCGSLLSCSSESPTESTTPPQNEHSSVTENASDIDTLRYGMAGHFPASITENRYNEKGQLLRVTALSALNLAPDYLNLDYVINKEFVYQDGTLTAMYWNRTHIPLTYDATTRIASGTAKFSESETVKAEISFNAQDILVKESYRLNDKPFISYEYDQNGTILKEIRHEHCFEMNFEYTDSGFTYTILRTDEENKVHLTAEVTIGKDGLIQSLTQTANGQSEVVYYTYDANRHCIEAKMADPNEFIYTSTYDADGRLISTQNSSAGDGYRSETQFQFAYNDSGKLISFIYSNQYTLLTDPANPVLTHTVTTFTYTYGADGRMEKITKVKETYDKNGNMTGSTTDTY